MDDPRSVRRRVERGSVVVYSTTVVAKPASVAPAPPPPAAPPAAGCAAAAAAPAAKRDPSRLTGRRTPRKRASWLPEPVHAAAAAPAEAAAAPSERAGLHYFNSEGSAGHVVLPASGAHAHVLDLRLAQLAAEEGAINGVAGCNELSVARALRRRPPQLPSSLPPHPARRCAPRRTATASPTPAA